MAKIRNIIEEQVPIFRKLVIHGINDLNTALLYLSIYSTYESYKHIERVGERKLVVAEVCKCSKDTVARAIKIMELELKKAV